ncbi:hypothetical protein [Tropicimonas isoalkanivorans]|uniref:Uncharacterized protein n=1 Tax=Tropicimonas isoalkanivorans TaxID=441112 RepID=A0A1I1EEW1_9RHOB|nr:hypothetical protein [Tropicimonas isoalkanivorans]SFB85699.1 hypothetical protein SAMN04488094_101784 [Tropicimonas isoalkanivorans]
MKDPDPEKASETPCDHHGPDDPDRRAALKAVQKYAACVAGTSTVILSADDALAAQSFCSVIDPDRNAWIYHWFCDGPEPDGPGKRSKQPNGNLGLQRFDRDSNGFRPK